MREYCAHNGRIAVEYDSIYHLQGDERAEIPEDTSSILIRAGVEIGHRELSCLAKKGIPVHFFNRHGYYEGTFYPRESRISGHMLMKQAKHRLDPVKHLEIAREMARATMYGLLANLKQISGGTEPEEHRDMLHYLLERTETGDVEGIRDILDAAEAVYLSAWGLLMPGDMDEKERRNATEALFLMADSLLYTASLSAIYRSHLNPAIGFLHSETEKRFSLAQDLVSIFRPFLVDRMLISMLQSGELGTAHFERDLKMLSLTEEGSSRILRRWYSLLRKRIWDAGMEEYLTYSELLSVELHKLERHLIGAGGYRAFRPTDEGTEQVFNPEAMHPYALPVHLYESGPKVLRKEGDTEGHRP